MRTQDDVVLGVLTGLTDSGWEPVALWSDGELTSILGFGATEVLEAAQAVESCMIELEKNGVQKGFVVVWQVPDADPTDVIPNWDAELGGSEFDSVIEGVLGAGSNERERG